MFRSRLPEILRQREVEKNERITYQMIQDGTGLSAATIARFKSPGLLAAFESATVEKLCRFLDCQFADIVEHVEDSLDE